MSHDPVLQLRPFLLSPLLHDRRLTSHGRDAERLLPQLAPDLWTLLQRHRHLIEQPVCLGDETGDSVVEAQEETIQQSIVFSLSVAVLICLSDDVSSFMPAVYSHIYVLQELLPLVIALFERSEPEVTQKALFVLNRLLSNVGESALPASFCDVLSKQPIHRSLIRVMRYSSDASCRSEAVNLFKRLVQAFDAAGRVKCVTVMISDPQQVPAVIELLLQQYRNFLTSDQMHLYSGCNLQAVVTAAIIACTRHSDSSSPSHGLLSKSECILSLLNLIRFLFLSDFRKRSGIKDMSSVIRSRLIGPLKEELTKRKAEQEIELSNVLKNDSASNGKRVDTLKNMQIRIANDESNAENVTDDCPDDFEEQGLRMSLIKIDMIQSVVNRVEELIP